MTQWEKWLKQLSDDGRGGAAAQLPSISRGRGAAFVYELTQHPVYGDWTDGTFSAAIRIAPDAPVALATFTVETGTPSGGVTPINLTLGAGAQAGLPADGDGDGVESALYELVYTPNSGDATAIAGGEIRVTGAV